ncbi:hypothetical protein K7X08_022442 [Anisodus acutangulus]|uniref:PHD and RING finger domain-containing protein 1 n=1 Tax=Anisodus acutangulus TaxID=402998 RepID=A0A9Q1MN32_9SOLA|nr:hypothetical protein K7X08_022442 [Anisodus acutangulus]
MSSDPDDIGAPEIHPNKRVKTLTLSSPDKGKSKLELSDSDCCGICLTETGHGTTIIRGCIDCCDHYFCFVCIIEWSKVESRCPMCKRRFSTIRRPIKPPVFPTERIVNVPVRDQVYHHLGNATTGPRDLYAEVQCNVCHSTADDSLLLLCDLCDTAYHTYCVGLGATVPEGDWFCADCSLLKAEQAQNEIKTDCYTQTQTSFSDHHSAESARHVSVYDIVRESYVDGVDSAPAGSLDASDNSSRINTGRQTTSRSSSIGLGSVGQNGVAGRATKFNARTLGHCRNVHNRIRTLRDHWNGFRSGSLRFPSSKTSNASIGKLKPVRGSCSGERPLVSCSSQSMTSQSSNQNRPDSKGSMEVEKAWKMLDMAKAIAQNSDRNKSSGQASKHTVKKNTSCTEAGESSSRYISLKIEQHRPTYIQNSGPGSHSESHVCKLDIKLKGSSGVYKGSSRACGPSNSELVSSKESQTSLQPDVCPANNGLSQKNKFCAGSTHLISSIRSASIATTVGYHKEICSSSNSIVNPPQEKPKVEKTGIKRRVEVESDAKTEIQSLVKLNLKILCKDKKLEVGTFKQVARLTTHSILAACGLEHKAPGISPLPECVCVHAEEDKEVRRSTLMPKSCRECFFSFVKNVVNTILLDHS